MANIFDKWDATIDTKGLQKDIKEAAENGGDRTFKEVEHGKYEVAIDQMELKASKKGKPMVSIWFKIVSAGEFKGSLIFYNQVVTEGFQVHMANTMLKSLTSQMEDAPVIEFTSYKDYANLIMDIHEAIADNFEYGLDYQANKKNPNFHTYKITDVFVLE